MHQNRRQWLACMTAAGAVGGSGLIASAAAASAAGPAADVLTPDNLRRTYAGRLDVLDELGRAVARRERTP